MNRPVPAPAQSIQAAHIIRSFAEEPGKIYLLYGDPFVFNLSLRMAAQAMAHGSSIAVVDGCNRFDVHALTRFARERRIDPNKFLRHIYISRGFTCYQMEQGDHRQASRLSCKDRLPHGNDLRIARNILRRTGPAARGAANSRTGCRAAPANEIQRTFHSDRLPGAHGCAKGTQPSFSAAQIQRRPGL